MSTGCQDAKFGIPIGGPDACKKNGVSVIFILLFFFANMG